MPESKTVGSGGEGTRSGVLENSNAGGIRILLSASREGMRLSGIGTLMDGRRGDGSKFRMLTGLIGSAPRVLGGLLAERTVGAALVFFEKTDRGLTEARLGEPSEMNSVGALE